MQQYQNGQEAGCDRNSQPRMISIVLVSETPEEAVRLPFRTVRRIPDFHHDRARNVLKLRRGLKVDRLVQIVRRSVVTLG